jgi:ParB family chromosome partitioning protein
MERQEEFKSIPVEALRESALNTRRTFKDQGLTELADSIRQKGVISPLIARPIGEDGAALEIAAGHRRYRAAQLAGVEVLPVIIRNYSDDEFLEVLTVENLQREDVHPMEEAEGYLELLRRPGYDIAAIAAKIGKDASYVTRRIRLNELIQPLRDAFRAEKLTLGHAQVLARLGADQQRSIADRELWDEDGGAFSVQALQRVIEDDILMDLSKAAFPVADVKLVPAAGACVDCTKRTGASPSLFPEIKAKDCCTDRECFHLKSRAFAYAKVKAVTKDEGRAPLKLSAHYNAMGEADVLANVSWKPAKKSKCDHAQRGVIVATGFGEDYRVGDVLDVCTQKKCTIHWGPQSYHGESAPRPKRTAEEALSMLALEEKTAAGEAVRKALIGAAVEAAVYPFSLKVLREITRVMWTRLWSDSQVVIRARRGLEPRNNRTFPPGPDSMLQEIEDSAAGDLAGIIVEIAIMESGGGRAESGQPDLMEMVLSTTSDDVLCEIEANARQAVKEVFDAKRKKVTDAAEKAKAADAKAETQPAATPAAKKGKAKKS